MTQKFCRLCLVKPSIYFSILDNKISQMLEALTFNKIAPTDEISTIICLKCLLNLKLAYNFQQKIKKSERNLTEKIPVKDEVNEETNQDLVKLCDRSCTICGLDVADNLINDHVREHFTTEQKCGFCEKTFSNIQLYREHLYEHPDRGLHQCTNCDAKFQYKSFYDSHIRTVCSLGKPAQQRIARLGLRSKQAISLLTIPRIKRRTPIALNDINNEDTRRKVFQLGLRSSKSIKVLMGTEEKDESRICNICFKKFTKKSFQCHTHETKTCNYCNREVSKNGYKKHIEDHVGGPQICHLCGATLQNKSCLSAHIFYSHNELRYKCDHCGKVFQKKMSRDLHIQKEHVGKPTHYCDTCGKGFFTGRFLNKHIKMKHLKLRPYVCEFCKKGFSSPYALKTHRRQHTNETPYRCEVCGAGFRQNVSLRAHRKSKHDIVEEEICNCKVCGKGFASDSALYAHMRLH